ncbi:HlyD family secretion protein [Clostridium aceticum]|uniref:HlyD family secretion protein n=1 Tax=Clostridium aceticum TaxID=84022 RepID=A0A0D8I9C7_9CLOT|nr:HlyD family efflux transporter periplasmic adaptor subunit [Clostridium aceticum]AKL95561.1 HlyD family secretion protein [Clostridium aceticum]KJF26858.1 hypothetical protein TZ02_11690 [Clostridium aceticum]
MKTKRKKRKSLSIGKLIKIFAATIILGYFLSRVTPFFSQATNKTYIAEHGKIETTVSTEGYIVRDEKVMKNLGEGKVVLYVSEGEKVARNQKLAEIHLGEIDEKTTRDLEIINLRIQNIKDKESEQQVFSRDIEKIDAEITAILGEIQQYINEGPYEKISLLKENLSTLVEKKSIISGERSFSGKNLDQLERQQQSLQSKVNDSIEIVYSEFPGVFAIGNDGLEELLNLRNIENITEQEWQTIKNTYKSKGDSLEQNSLRIIENHRWSIVARLKELEIEGVEENRRIMIRLRGDSKEYSAVVRKILPVDEEEVIVILDLTDFIEGFYNKRLIAFDMIKSSFEGIMIPNSAIVEKEGQEGIFRLDVNGFARFVPIKVKGSNREYSIVHYGYFDDTRNNETKRVNTMNFYDEIVVNAQQVTEGEKIR